MLYKIGIVLLEIEFEATLHKLILDSKIEGPTDIHPPLTQPLPLLKRRAGSQLRTPHGRIIRVFLDCDVRLALDDYTLDDPRVQKILYSQIVRQFQKRMPEYNQIWSDE